MRFFIITLPPLVSELFAYAASENPPLEVAFNATGSHARPPGGAARSANVRTRLTCGSYILRIELPPPPVCVNFVARADR